MQQALLSLLLIFFSAPLLARLNVTIEIDGIDSAMEDNVRLYLSIEQQKNHPSMTEGRLRRLHKKSTQEISKALQPFGYYHPQIESKISHILGDDTTVRWRVSYNIDPGPPVLVDQFNFTLSDEMREDKNFQALIDELPIKQGSVFSHIEYERFKTSLAKTASEWGYFNARFVEHRVEIDLDTNKVAIFLHYEGSTRYVFGDVKLEQDVLRPALLQRYIPFEKGDPYSFHQLIDFQQALNDSYYFQTVEVSPGKPLHDSREIPVTVQLTPRKRHRFNFGLGYGTDTGARAKFGWEIPRVNKRGHRFDSEINVSHIGHSLIANYRVPVFNPRTDQLIYSAGVINETIDTRESTLRTLGITLKHTRNEWLEAISLNFQRENFVVAGDSGISTLLIPRINWSRTWGNDFIYAVDGLRFDLDLRGASEALVSDTDFAQLLGSIKFISSLDSKNRFITRGTLGSTWTNEFNKLPTSVRFFAGGAQSVRGYSYESLGPVDANGEVIGGKYLLEGSIEFEHSFKELWSVAVFYDAGNAVDNLNDDMAKGAGFGFRWKSPVGPVRIDFANALSVDSKPWRVHITVGPDL